jgi:type VI secretion system secreted protein Hcp
MVNKLRPSSLSRTLALVPPAIVLVAQHASGAFDVFIKIGDIKGESTEDGHKDWIQLDSVQWAVGRTISAAGGGSTTRDAGAPRFSEVTITKTVDSTSPALFLHAVGGSGQIPEVTLHLVDPATKHVFYILTLGEVLVSSQSHSGVSGDGTPPKPTESVSLNFTKIEIEYKRDEKDPSSTPNKAGWDLKKNTKV